MPIVDCTRTILTLFSAGLYFNKKKMHSFMDCLIPSLQPLRTTVYFKPTHSCSYIPWGRNTPTHTKTGWLRAECIRYLWLCSSEITYGRCVARLRGAIKRLNYPKSAADPMGIQKQVLA